MLVRHGEPEWVVGGYNVDNPPLTDRGHRQAAAMAEALRGEHFDEVYVSPLVRARQTAAPLYDALGRPEHVDGWLEEIRNPVWHGTPVEKAELAYREERSRPSHEQWAGIEGGEPVRDFVDRIHAGCLGFLRDRGVQRSPGDLPVWQIEQPERRIALVAHAGTNSVVVCHLLGLTPVPWEWERFVLGHASITRYTFGLTKLSDVEHLAPEDRTN